MNRIFIILAVAMLAAAADQAKTFTGTITDSMCLMNHKMMKITPDSKCARDCVKNGKDVKYVLHDGKNTYKLSDQKTPEQFAGQKVKVTGILYPKTAVLEVNSIQAVK